MEFIETSVFTNEIRKLLPDEEYRRLQLALLFRPTAGPLIRGSGSLRKIRWKTLDKGARGGLRVIYYWDAPDTIYMLFPYKKSAQEDLRQSQLKVLSKLVKEWLR